MSSPPAPRTERVDEGVVAVTAPNPGPLTLEGTRTWIIGVERLAVVDPGPANPAHLDRVADEIGGRPVVGVFLTHAHGDHAAAAAEASERWGPLHASPETLSRLGLAGVSLGDGHEAELGATRGRRATLRALATPGHSGDHLAYLVLPFRDLLTGDLVLGRGSSMVAHPDGSVRAFLSSLERLAALEPRRLLPGHGPVVEDAASKLREYADHRRERTEQVRAALASGARGRAELMEAVYGELPPELRGAAELSLRAHLRHVEELGRD